MPLDSNRVLIPSPKPEPWENWRWFKNIRFLLLLIGSIIPIVTFVVGWINWIEPQFAPNYKTEFLVDTSSGVGGSLKSISDSLATVVQNSGDQDALAVRRFGGICGDDGNTHQLVDFGTNNRTEIGRSVSHLMTGKSATLQKGIIQAVEDFSSVKPFALKAKQVNRIIVVTSHGKDACDDDQAFVDREIHDRVAAAGLKIEFRLVGYQIPNDQREALKQLATGAGAPDPTFAENQTALYGALNRVANVEPVVVDVRKIISILNPAIADVNDAVQATMDNHLDAAQQSLSKATDSITSTDAEFTDLRGRTGEPTLRPIYDLASEMRSQQQKVVRAAGDLLAAAKAGVPLEPKLATFRQTAGMYNDDVGRMNQLLTNLQTP